MDPSGLYLTLSLSKDPGEKSKEKNKTKGSIESGSCLTVSEDGRTADLGFCNTTWLLPQMKLSAAIVYRVQYLSREWEFYRRVYKLTAIISIAWQTLKIGYGGFRHQGWFRERKSLCLSICQILGTCSESKQQGGSVCRGFLLPSSWAQME